MLRVFLRIKTRPASSIPSARWASSSSSKKEEEQPPLPRPSLTRVLTDPDLLGRTLEVSGWVRSTRRHGALIFVDLDDGSDPVHNRLQVVMEKEEEATAARVKFHSSVTVRGVLRPSSHPKQEVELLGHSMRMHNITNVDHGGRKGGKEDQEEGEEESSADGYYPFAPRKVYKPKFVRQFPSFRAKLPEFASVLRLRSALSGAIRAHLDGRGFVHVHTPILTTTDCEGGCEVFAVKPLRRKKDSDDEAEVETEEGGELYSSDKVVLTVSDQLHLEAICNGLAKVYNFSPAFRVEGGRSRRHLTEFTMVEVEEAFTDQLSEMLSTAEILLKSAVGCAMDAAAGDVHTHARIAKRDNSEAVRKLLSRDFVTMSYKVGRKL